MKIHFIGIGGISMSALATLMLARGHRVSGSDVHNTILTDKLVSNGIRFFDNQTAENIQRVNPDQIIYTAAINEHNPELIAARASGKPVRVRADFLGQLTKEYAHSIAVAGTHGKTTTTAMLTLALLHCQADPTALVGGHLNEINGNLHIGQSDIFLTEACEYQETFLSLAPYIGIILNIDKDHLDYFNSFNHIIQAFSKFSQRIAANGFLVIHGDDPNCKTITDNLNLAICSFGLNHSNDWYADDIILTEEGSDFTVFFQQKEIIRMHLHVLGKHNINNALAALATCHCLGLDIMLAAQALNNFKGTHRRFEYRGKLKGAHLIDDYAHHPQEVIATLEAAKQSYHPRRIIVVFQPHTFSRTKALLHDFAHCFSLVDELIITKTYPAREPYDPNGDSQTLVAALKKHHQHVQLVPTYYEAAQTVDSLITKDDLVLTMGAGPVNQVIDYLLEKKPVK